MFRDGTSATDATVFADAPLTIDNDMPTAPSTGTASFARLRFEACFVFGMSVLPCLLANIRRRPPSYSYALHRHLARPTKHSDWRRTELPRSHERMLDFMNDT